MKDETTAPRTRRRDAVANREALLAAAFEVLRRDPEAPLDEIASAAGLSRRSFYGHFSSREQLLGEIVDRGTAHITEALAGTHDEDPAQHIARIGSTLWREITHVRLLAHLIVRGPFESAVARGLAPIRRSLRDAVARGAASGAFRQDADPEIVARLVEAATLTVLDVAVAHEMTDSSAEDLVVTTALGVAGLSWRDARAAADAAHRGESA
ncbi:TetR/AcrR family transcriptional regulator [Microbacterium sp. gxy059]|uniref:TetR/AcrR family transcriptional regulator n=1 Tax=Microbacterium sp. gxy059 TaxID=2957199 RepID=UPI003D97C326